MIANMMMYARPELDAAHDRYWQLIRKELTTRGIDSPRHLAQQAEEFAVWRDPDLVLSQTCGMPYRLFLHQDVTLIGTPDFGLQGCAPGYYASALVVRKEDPRTKMQDFVNARFAFNQTISQSGWAAPYAHVTGQTDAWFTSCVQTGAHLMSAKAVADGTADIAALDGQTWRLISEFEPCADVLRILDWTAPTPGLPYIAGPGADTDLTFDAVAAAIQQLLPEDRARLGINGLVKIPKSAYLAVPNPPEDAAACTD